MWIKFNGKAMQEHNPYKEDNGFTACLEKFKEIDLFDDMGLMMLLYSFYQNGRQEILERTRNTNGYWLLRELEGQRLNPTYHAKTEWFDPNSEIWKKVSQLLDTMERPS